MLIILDGEVIVHQPAPCSTVKPRVQSQQTTPQPPGLSLCSWASIVIKMGSHMLFSAIRPRWLPNETRIAQWPHTCLLDLNLKQGFKI